MTVGFVEKEGADVGVKGTELGHRKVGEYAESSAKTVVSYCRYAEDEPDILCQANQAAEPLRNTSILEKSLQV